MAFENKLIEGMHSGRVSIEMDTLIQPLMIF